MGSGVSVCVFSWPLNRISNFESWNLLWKTKNFHRWFKPPNSYRHSSTMEVSANFHESNEIYVKLWRPAINCGFEPLKLPAKKLKEPRCLAPWGSIYRGWLTSLTS